MATDQPVIVGDSFALGYRFQRYWNASMASAFFFGELGAGLFIVSMFYGVVPGMIAGLVATGILKAYFHLAHMGVPGNSWRAIMRPDRAWISRGIIAIGFFVVFGVAHVLLEVGGIFGLELGAVGGALPQAIKTIAVLAALGVLLYHGFLISHSSAISLWSTGLMPIVSIIYALLGGAAVTAALGWNGLAGEVPDAMLSLHVLTLILLAALAVVLFSLMYAGLNGAPGARVSVNLLLKGPFAKLFVPLVIGVGLALPLLLLLWAPATDVTSLIVAAAILVGYYAFRVYIFKAGVYDPIMSFAPTHGAS
jgi:formate-dependent nitrite reductase membrane component NrfD